MEPLLSEVEFMLLMPGDTVSTLNLIYYGYEGDPKATYASLTTECYQKSEVSGCDFYEVKMELLLHPDEKSYIVLSNQVRPLDAGEGIQP